jgi:6-phosphogluconolactonase
MDAEILIFDSAVEAAQACGARSFELLEAARQARGRAAIAISGGNTPRVMFEWMAKQDFDWAGVDLFWVDERCVPPDDKQSNYRMTREALLGQLLDKGRISAGQIHRIQGELPPEDAAKLYAEEVRSLLGERPVFDVIQRGMGPDGHTASLFPGEPLIADAELDGGKIAATVWVEKMKQHRVTLLRGVLEAARATLCLATGEEKAQALKRVLQSPVNLMEVPAQIRSDGMVWYVDRAAADLL